MADAGVGQCAVDTEAGVIVPHDAVDQAGLFALEGGGGAMVGHDVAVDDATAVIHK